MANLILPGLKPLSKERVRLTVYVDRDVDDIIRLLAVEHDSNVSRVVEEIIKTFIREHCATKEA